MTNLTNKLRGGYYTPEEVARFICKWAINDHAATVLEPSCGDGVFISAAKQRLHELGSTNAEEQIMGIELFPQEAEKAELYGCKVLKGDFFTHCKNTVGKCRYDAIVGNPPFIRYQDFQEEYRSIAFKLMEDFGFKPNRLTNIWLPFLVICCNLLSPRGRLGMVIPAELFQVNYAAEARNFLLDFFANINVVTFSKLLFDGAQQEVILLLAERSELSVNQGVRIIEETSVETLAARSLESISMMPLKRKLPNQMKWQAYYLNERALNLISSLNSRDGIIPLSDLAEINVGVVSGQNSFFVIDERTAMDARVMDSCVPIVSRSMQLEGLNFNKTDYLNQLAAQRKVLLFLPQDKLGEDDTSYVHQGESEGINKNYKCRIRTPWYKVPTSWKPEAFFYRQVGSYPRVVLNEADAHTTDTLHKVRFKKGVNGKAVAVAFNNSLTFLMSELIGRSYGGGVLTFEPSEARIIPIPYCKNVCVDFEKADQLIRKGKIDKLIADIDQKVLVDGIGISKADPELLRESWVQLRDRRLNRKKS